MAQWQLAEGKSWRSKLEWEHPSHGQAVMLPLKVRGFEKYLAKL